MVGQHAAIQPDVVDPSAERGADAAPSDVERPRREDCAVDDVVGRGGDRPGDAIDKHPHSRRPARAVVGDGEVVPTIERERFVRDHLEGPIGPLVNDMNGHLRLFENQVVAPERISFIHFGENRARFRARRMNPHREGKRPVGLKRPGFASRDVGLAVEQERPAEPPLGVFVPPDHLAGNSGSQGRGDHRPGLVIERKPGHQSRRLGRGETLRRQRSLPSLLVGRAVLRPLGQPFRELGTTPLEPLPLSDLLRRGNLEERFGHPPLAVANDLVGDIVEQRRKPVVVGLGKGIVFVVMAAGALEREAEEGSRGGVDPVGDILHPVLLVDDPPFGREHVIAAEASGHPLGDGGISEQVARHLLGHELVEGDVLRERPDHPIPPGPERPRLVVVVAVGVGVPGDIEPLHRHPLGIPRRHQKSVDHALVGRGSGIGEKRCNLLRRRRKARQIEGHAPQPGRPVGLGRGLEPLCFEPGKNEPIEIAPRPIAAPHRRDRRALSGKKGPVGRERGTGIDPPDEEGPLLAREGLAKRFRWHLRLVRRMDAGHHRAGRRITGHDRRRAAVARRQGFAPDVEPQAGLAGMLVRPVATPAMVDEDRLHRPSQLQIRFRSPRVHGRQRGEHEQPEGRPEGRVCHRLISQRTSIPRSLPEQPQFLTVSGALSHPHAAVWAR